MEEDISWLPTKQHPPQDQDADPFGRIILWDQTTGEELLIHLADYRNPKLSFFVDCSHWRPTGLKKMGRPSF